jgi:general secretion pathway protein G
MFSAIRSFRTARRAQSGMTLLELIIACAILLVLATAAMPVARFTVKRQKEAELHRDLHEMRDAIDRYKDAADRGRIRVEAGTEGYPPDLATLVTGVDVVAQGGAGTPLGAGIQSALGGAPPAGQSAFGGGQTIAPFGSAATSASGAGAPAVQHVRFLRRIPIDPMTGNSEWGMRAVQDDPDSSSWGGRDVFDVYSLSVGTGLDNTKYADW